MIKVFIKAVNIIKIVLYIVSVKNFLNVIFKFGFFFEKSVFLRNIVEAVLFIMNAVILNILWGKIKSSVFIIDICFVEIVVIVLIIKLFVSSINIDISLNVKVLVVMIIR